jgi:hypothetical protein
MVLLVVLGGVLAGCSQSTCVAARVLPWDGRLTDGGMATTPDQATCDHICALSTCSATDAGIHCDGQCIAGP